jgi:transcriptional regulator with XRE-family HTH domain
MAKRAKAKLTPSQSKVASKKNTFALDEIIGSRVRAKRMEIGMSQETLGKALGLTFQQVQKYEKGVNRIGAGRLSQIADILGTEMGYFMRDLSNGGKRGLSPFEAFMATREGAAIVEAMIELNLELRRTVIDVARRLAVSS